MCVEGKYLSGRMLVNLGGSGVVAKGGVPCFGDVGDIYMNVTG